MFVRLKGCNPCCARIELTVPILLISVLVEKYCRSSARERVRIGESTGIEARTDVVKRLPCIGTGHIA